MHTDLYGRPIRTNDYGHTAASPGLLLRVTALGHDELRPNPTPTISVREVGGDHELRHVRADSLSPFVLRGHYG